MTMASAPNFQDAFLNQIRKENVQVMIYLKNGTPLQGFIKGFDSFSVILEVAGKQQMIYKHTISTISQC